MVEDVVKRLVDDPMITPAELEARRKRRLALLERGFAPSTPPPGKVEADVKLSTLIGGLARIKDRSEAQVLAAARYRGLFERSQIGGAKAVDYGAVRVDTSAGSVDLVFELGEDARREYRGAVQRLGLLRSALVEQVVCHNRSLREVARLAGEGNGGSARGRIETAVLAGVDVLVEHFGYGASAARDRVAMRAQVEVPTTINGHEVVKGRRWGN